MLYPRTRPPAKTLLGSAPATSGPFGGPNKTIRLSFIAFVLVAIGAPIVALNPALARKALQNRIFTSGMHHHPTIIRLRVRKLASFDPERATRGFRVR